MLCDHCGTPYPPDSKFCPNCGTQLTTVEKEIVLPQPLALPLSMQPSPSAPHDIPMQCPPVTLPAPVKQGSLRVPICILAALCVVGLILFTLFPGDSGSGQNQSVGSASHFVNDGGYLYFDESRYTGFEELTVPEKVDGLTVTHIGKHCFYNCDTLTTVILPNTVQSIEDRAFYGSDRLRGIAIPDGVLFIGTEAFADCDSLEAITIPVTVEYLAVSAFEDCSKLKYVFYSGTVEQWNRLFDGADDSDAIVYCSDGQCPLEWTE